MEARRVRVRVRVRKARANSILIASRQKLFAQAIGHALEAEGMDVVAIAATGAEALAHASCGPIATALIDLDLPDAPGVNVGRELMRRYPGIVVVAMSDPVDYAKVTEALDSGFGGFLSRGMDVHRLISEITPSVNRWAPVLAPFERPDGGGGEPPPEATLNADERDVVQLLKEGATAEEMGRALNLGKDSVLGRVWDVLSKLENESSETPGRLGRGNHYPRHLRSR